MTAPSEIDAAPREDDLSPDISKALKRIKSGWKLGLIPDVDFPDDIAACVWVVWSRHAPVKSYGVFVDAAEARAEYLRLSAREE
jgi:hypothetical protein